MRFGVDARTALAENDSATYLGAIGDQLRCEPTGTNVGDVVVVYRSANG
jgi:glycerate-2-kinase